MIFYQIATSWMNHIIIITTVTFTLEVIPLYTNYHQNVISKKMTSEFLPQASNSSKYTCTIVSLRKSKWHVCHLCRGKAFIVPPSTSLALKP